jgi:rhodanese-related sulfurtransferase
VKNAILLTIDTLRKDAVGCYGDNDGLTLFIDSIQDRFIRFTRAQSIGPYTQASCPGMLTSSYYLEYLKEERREELNLVDVRSREECVQEGMIPGAIHIPLDQLRDQIDQLDKDRETLVYCATGLRSYLATRILMQKGFTHVKNLTGGTVSWVYPLKKGNTR